MNTQMNELHTVTKRDRELLEIVGLAEEDLSLEALRKAYRKRAIEYHPDKNNGSKESEDKFKELSEAYSELLKKFDKDSIKEIIHEEDLDEFDIFLYEVIEEAGDDLDEMSRIVWERLKGSYDQMFTHITMTLDPNASFMEFMSDFLTQPNEGPKIVELPDNPKALMPPAPPKKKKKKKKKVRTKALETPTEPQLEDSRSNASDNEPEPELEIVRSGRNRSKPVNHEEIQKAGRNTHRQDEPEPKLESDIEPEPEPEFEPDEEFDSSGWSEPEPEPIRISKPKPTRRFSRKTQRGVVPVIPETPTRPLLPKRRKKKTHPHIRCKIPVSLEDLYYNNDKVISIKAKRNNEYVIHDYLIKPAVRTRVWEHHGDQFPGAAEPGNLIIETELEPTKDYYIQGTYDLVKVHKVSLYEYIFTSDMEIEFLDKTLKIRRELDIHKQELVVVGPPNNTYVYPNQGLIKDPETGERGDLIIKLAVLLRTDTCVEVHDNLLEFFPPLVRK